MVGNMANFSEHDILRCFLLLEEKIGRKGLSEKLGIGEGTIRSILDILKKKGFLDSTKKGHFLSKEGRAELLQIKKEAAQLKRFKLDKMYGKSEKFGILIKDARIEKEIYILRDFAVKSGSEGAVIFRYEEKLIAPGTGHMDYFKELESLFNLEKGDSLIVSFAESPKNAQAGAFAVASQISQSIKNFLKKVKK